jgi:hypothetical protein
LDRVARVALKVEQAAHVGKQLLSTESHRTLIISTKRNTMES